MGDRANVLVKDSYDPGVYLYTHWGGSDLPLVLQSALSKQWRWDDASYLARIIFCEMIQGEERGETGYGISSVMGDGDNRVLVVDCSKQMVSYNNTQWSFVQYVNLIPEQIESVWDSV